MICPQCGYVLTPFERECPRCKIVGKQQTNGNTPHKLMKNEYVCPYCHVIIPRPPRSSSLKCSGCNNTIFFKGDHFYTAEEALELLERMNTMGNVDDNNPQPSPTPTTSPESDDRVIAQNGILKTTQSKKYLFLIMALIIILVGVTAGIMQRNRQLSPKPLQTEITDVSQSLQNYIGKWVTVRAEVLDIRSTDNKHINLLVLDPRAGVSNDHPNEYWEGATCEIEDSNSPIFHQVRMKNVIQVTGVVEGKDSERSFLIMEKCRVEFIVCDDANQYPKPP